MDCLYSGAIYTSGTITANGNSGVLALAPGVRSYSGLTERGILYGLFRIVPSDLATDETLDVVAAFSWDSSGTGEHDVITFTQVTNTNAAESKYLTVSTDSPVPPYVKFTHTLGGTTKSMSYIIYAVVFG